METFVKMRMEIERETDYINRYMYTVKKYAAVWNQKLYIPVGEYSGISSLKLKNSGI
jgi:hypothetical protein